MDGVRGCLSSGKCFMVLGVCSKPHGLINRTMKCCYGMGMCYYMLSWSSKILGTFLCRGILHKRCFQCLRDMD
jgi:hypothetical protein